MGLRNPRTGILDFDARGGGVDDRANQDHPAGAVIADGIIDEVCQQLANQDAIPGDHRAPVKSIELHVNIPRESLRRTLRQDVEGDLVQIDVFGDRLRNVLLIGPRQGDELPEQPFKAIDRIIHFVKGGLARWRLRSQASHEIEMRPQYRQRRSHLVGGIGGESAHQFNGQIQSLQQRIYGKSRRQGFLRHPGKVERTEIWAAVNTPGINFPLEFAKWPQASIDRVPAEARNEPDQSGLENGKSNEHFTFDGAARLYRFGDSDEDQPRPAVNLPRLHANANRFAAV